MASELERLSDKVLFQIIKQIAENCESDSIPLESEFSDDIMSVIDETLSIFGVIDNPEYIDDEFLWTVLKMNINKLSDDKLVGNLERPDIKEYEFNIDVSETIYQTSSWTQRIESYGNPYRMARAMEYNGDLDYWGGRQGYTDIHDTETNDIKIDKRSFREI